MRVLVVEDEPRMAALVRRALERSGYAIDVARDGTEAWWSLTEHTYAAVVLDAMIPEPDGFELCRRLRSAGNQVPVLMLTARDSVGDRVAGLDAGADDYLTKPFALEELFARVRALVRRGPSARSPVLEVGELKLDPATHEVWRDGQAIELTPRCFSVLELLMVRAGQAVSRTELLQQVWDFAYDGTSNVVDAHVSRVRDAIDRPFPTALIETVRGVGYRLRVPDGEA